LSLGAFFVATDPVTGCISARGRLIFGAGVGALTWLIWKWSGNPLGLAFAVLLMNSLAPWIDRHARSRIRREAT
jgi:electron transport complex protein RnfD